MPTLLSGGLLPQFRPSGSYSLASSLHGCELPRKEAWCMMMKTPKERSRVQSQCLEGPRDSLCGRGGRARAQHSDAPSPCWMPPQPWPQKCILSLNNPHSLLRLPHSNPVLSVTPAPTTSPSQSSILAEVRGQWLFSSCSSLDVLFVERIVFFPAPSWRLTRGLPALIS